MFKIAICGSASENLPKDVIAKAGRVGKQLAKEKIIIFSGATTGYSFQAAKIAGEHGALTVGISPAENLTEHVKVYKLPCNPYKVMIFTGLGYKARDIIMIRSVDAAIFIGGGVGTIVEFCASIDNQKLIGVLSNSGGATVIFKQIAKYSHRVKPEIIFDSDPERLVKKIIFRLKRREKNEKI